MSDKFNRVFCFLQFCGFLGVFLCFLVLFVYFSSFNRVVSVLRPLFDLIPPPRLSPSTIVHISGRVLIWVHVSVCLAISLVCVPVLAG